MYYALTLVISYIGIFLRGLQHKNVVAGWYKASAVTAFCIALFEFGTITLVIKGGWTFAVVAGFGAAAGIVTAMWSHDRIQKKKLEAVVNE